MCTRCKGLMYRERLDNDLKCWQCGRPTYTRHATAEDNESRKYDSNRGGRASALKRLKM